MREIAIYLKNTELLICGYCLATDGLLMSCEPYIKLASLDPEEIGTAVTAALMSSTLGQTLDRPENVFEPMLNLAGAKNWTQFVKGRKQIAMSLDAGFYTLIPSSNKGPRSGYSGIRDKKRTIPRGTPEEVGKAVLEAFEDAVASE